MSGNKSKDKKHSQPPSLNKFMHPRNPYKNLPSFKELAIIYPEFRSHCTFDFKGKAFLDFKNAEALRTLTTCLLHKDFGLKVKIPDDRLVPTLPLRMNYLLWIEDLLSLVHPKIPVPSLQTPIVGVDIGTGAACVYPLLGNKKFGWHFIATEKDSISFESAKLNISENNLEDCINVVESSELFDVLKEEHVREFARKKKRKPNGTHVHESDSKDGEQGPLSSKECDDSYVIDFTICNPPFFSSEVEMDTNHNSKKETRSQPNSVSTGSFQEKITEGGEISFITKLIEKSIQHKDDIRIFTTLIGIKSDVKTVLNLIKKKAKNIPVCISETEFCQGRTMRWGVAWSFCSKIPLQRIVSKKKKLSQKPLILKIPRSLMSAYTVGVVWSLLQSWLKDIKIKPQIIKSTKYYMFAIVKAYKPTWLHQRQKRRQKIKQNIDQQNNSEAEESHSESENSPHKRKLTDALEGNLLKRLKLQMNENNEERMNESSEELRMNECNEDQMNESSKELWMNERNEEQMNELSEKLRMNECNEEQINESIDEIRMNVSNVDEILDSNSISNKVTESETCVTSTEEITRKSNVFQEVKEHISDITERISAQVSLGSSTPVNEKGVKAGLECYLKCSMQLKQTEALISLELNFLSGIGQKEGMYQLWQYINNRLRQNKRI